MTKAQPSTVREVDITPDVSLFKKIGSQPYRIPDAVAELVDNEIDARIAGEKLVVRVTLRMGKSPTIIVEGNGAGMTPEKAAMAMKMAHSSKSPEQIGEFGLGMKAACSNLGSSFEVITCTTGSKRATRIAYNEEDFLKAERWTIRLEEVEKPFDHGTRITVDEPKVNVYAGLKDTMLNAFSRTFKHFLLQGDVQILVNDEVVAPEAA
jgi:DNA topoisomerase VI subunit B